MDSGLSVLTETVQGPGVTSFASTAADCELVDTESEEAQTTPPMRLSSDEAA